jgi:hypothetical protein
LGGRGRWISEFEASLVYKVSSRTARATQRNPVSKNQKKKKKEKKKEKKTSLSQLEISGALRKTLNPAVQGPALGSTLQSGTVAQGPSRHRRKAGLSVGI